MSTTTCPPARLPGVPANGRRRAHAAALARACAPRIALSAASTSSAKVAINLEIVGSDATVAEQLGLGTHRGHIGQTVPAQRDRGRHIEQHLTRVVHRPLRAPRRQRRRQGTIQPTQPHRLRQQNRTRRRGQRLADGIKNRTRKPAVTLHLRSAFRSD